MVETDRTDETPTPTKTPQTVDKITLFGTPSYSTFSSNEQHVFECLGSVRCSESFDENNRPNLTIIAVVDVSSSMCGEKISFLKTTLSFLQTKLQPHDQFGIVVYNNVATVKLPLIKMDELGKQKSEKVINDIFARGGTNLCDGLVEGCYLIPESNNENSVTSVLLMTDGQTNVGITSQIGILKQLQHSLRDHPNVVVNTFGYGADHDAQLLQEIATSTKGSYYFIESDETIGAAFADCIGGLISVIGQNVELTITVPTSSSSSSSSASDIEISKIRGNYQVNKLSTNNGYRIRIGDIQAGENRDILFDVRIPSLSNDGSSNVSCDKYAVACLKLTYFDVIDETMKEISSSVIISRVPQEDLKDDENQPSLLVDQHKNRVKASEMMSEAATLTEAGNHDEARQILENLKEYLNASVSRNEAFCLGLIEEVESNLLATNQCKYGRYSSSSLRQSSLSFLAQRKSGKSRLFDSATRERMRFDSADYELQRKRVVEPPTNEASSATTNLSGRKAFHSSFVQRKLAGRERKHFDSVTFELDRRGASNGVSADTTLRSSMRKPQQGSLDSISVIEKKTVSFDNVNV